MMAALIQPLPWTADCAGDGGRVYDDNGFLVVAGLTADEAKFIVRACNNHEALLATLKALVESLNNDLSDEQCDAWDAGRAASADVEGSH